MSIKVSCPECGSTSFTENGSVPSSAEVLKWNVIHGVPYAQNYGPMTTQNDCECLNDFPYECDNCGLALTSEQLKVEKE